MSERRTRDPEATREAIFEAAEEEFLEHGLSGTVISAIATRAGVTKSLIHHHFGSKADLWTAVKSRRMSAYAAQQLGNLSDAKPSPELLRQSLADYFHFLQSNPQLVRLTAWMHIEGDDFGNVAQSLTQVGVQKFRDAQEHGLVRKDIDARHIFASFIGLAEHWFRDRHMLIRCCYGEESAPEALDEEYLTAITSLLMDGVRARDCD